MNRRYRPPRKKSNHTLPLAAAGLTVGALLLWGLFAKGQDIIQFFKGQTIVVPSNAEANANLSRLLADLSGDKARLLELAENSRSRLGWIENADTRRQFRWFLSGGGGWGAAGDGAGLPDRTAAGGHVWAGWGAEGGGCEIM